MNPPSFAPRFGFRTGSLEQPVEQAAAELKRLGYDLAEVCLEADDVRPETLDETRCRALGRTLDDLGIGLASVSYHGDREPLEVRRANQERAIHVARWLGTGIVVINAERSVEQERQWAEHVAHWQQLCRVAEEEGVVLAVEPEPLLVVGSSQDMLAMLRAVDSSCLRVNLDLGHAQVTDDDPAESIRQLGSAIVHLHFEDIKDRVHRHLLFGEGNIDFAAVRQALADIRYRGPYVVDLFGFGDDPSVMASRALEGMKRLFGRA